MSKHLGNVLEPIPLMDEHGADALRWFMAAGGSPWQARRVGHAAIGDVVRKVLLTYWNTASFLTLYANANEWSPARRRGSARRRPAGARPVGDQLAARLVRDVDAALDAFDTQRAGRLLGDVRRRPLELVRPPVAPPVLGRRPGRARDPRRVRAHA